ncbi:hypothetical protein [Ructibacterium gallinarum]|uniref:Uncharacterized protein n=1 Tax=Ructibacterium gallinarum TaxID=2779355 RepID=A0A9D5LWS3_9FIRM|nr:hypothetical protein [Ructibacterium gallinarum]MBE5039181.1 hypothetical protein [Ructibacterium gallinarum]
MKHSALHTSNQKDFFSAAGTVILSLLAVYGILWAFTADSLFGSATYNSYVLEAMRWLEGHLDLGRNYDYLEIAQYGGKYYVSFPPIPAVILLPFAALFGLHTPDHLIAVTIGMIGALYALRLAFSAGMGFPAAVLWTLLLTIGSNFLHIGYRADVWYFAQTCAFTFTMMSLYYAAEGGIKKAALPLFCLSLAVGCRPLNMVYLPLVLYLLFVTCRQNGGFFSCLRRFWWYLLPPLLVGGFLMLLNYLRFDNVFEFGHNYLPEFSEESPNGQFYLGYIPQNLKQMFRLPQLENGRLVFPIFNGAALWLFSPIFLPWLVFGIWAAVKHPKQKITWLCLLLPVLHLLLLCAHKTLGGWQFGNRYTVDLLPCIFFAVVYWQKNRDPKPDSWYLFPLLFWGMGMNLVGTIALMEQWIH